MCRQTTPTTIVPYGTHRNGVHVATNNKTKKIISTKFKSENEKMKKAKCDVEKNLQHKWDLLLKTLAGARKHTHTKYEGFCLCKFLSVLFLDLFSLRLRCSIEMH